VAFIVVSLWSSIRYKRRIELNGRRATWQQLFDTRRSCSEWARYNQLKSSRCPRRNACPDPVVADRHRRPLFALLPHGRR
jgi:hypothetical protein